MQKAPIGKSGFLWLTVIGERTYACPASAKSEAGIRNPYIRRRQEDAFSCMRLFLCAKPPCYGGVFGGPLGSPFPSSGIANPSTPPPYRDSQLLGGGQPAIEGGYHV